MFTVTIKKSFIEAAGAMSNLILVEKIELPDQAHAEAYKLSVDNGFIKFPAFTILECSIEESPSIKDRLVAIEQELAEDIIDEMEKCENAGHFTAGFENSDGDPMIVPEDAAPELDLARSLIQEAIDSLEDQI